MSKRIFPQQYGDRKKPKLDVSISDHNFPLSQNNGSNKESNQADTWGDDNDDEMLLLASQACEEACSISDISQLPNYSICMQPSSTSTQMYDQPSPSTSKAGYTFKKPLVNPPSIVSTQLKDKCSRISTPLPGISSKLVSKANGQVNVSDDLIFNDKIYKGQDSDVIYRQLLQLQEENAKLKSENGKLLEKCVTKEGEASILRTQLKNCQVAVDNVRLEKIKAQEKVQIEWTEKLAVVTNQMHDLRTQLDFKNLEIISAKEKCKKLESTKMKLTQVTVGSNDMSTSHRSNKNYIPHDSTTQRRVKTTSNAVQTDDKSHFLKLNKTCRKETSKLNTVLPYILQSSPNQQHSILDYSDKLQKHTELSQNKCRIFSKFHRVPSAPVLKESKSRMQLSCIYEDLSCIAMLDSKQEKYFNVFNAIKSVLETVHSRLEIISQRVTTAFQKEMDEKYIEVSSTYLDVREEDLWKEKALYKEEQEILARRMTAILACIIESPRGVQLFNSFENQVAESIENNSIIGLINSICVLLDSNSCATLYSGLLLSVTHLIQNLTTHTTHTNKHNTKIHDIIKTILTSRPMPFVSNHLLGVVRKFSLRSDFREMLCVGGNAGNLKVDYDQGVLLYKRDSCNLQVLLKQIEGSLKCIESQKLRERAVEITRHLIILHTNLNYDSMSLVQDKSRCDCQLVLVQTIVYALRICAVLLVDSKTTETAPSSATSQLLSVCRCGAHALYQCAARDVEFSSQLAHSEGHLIEFCEIVRTYAHGEVYSNMLSELAGTLQSSPEDMPPSFHKQAWLNSFKTFTIAD